MNDETVKGKWSEIKGDIRNMWGKLTHDELERTKGNLSAISGLIQQRYGETKEAVEAKLDQLMSKFQTSVADESEQAKNSMKKEDSNQVH
jgi:uncharacterized protein YjbJ (UPF0337 family)